MSYPTTPPLEPGQLTVIIREQCMPGATTDVLAERWNLDRREVQRMVRGLAKQRPLSEDDIALLGAG